MILSLVFKELLVTQFRFFVIKLILFLLAFIFFLVLLFNLEHETDSVDQSDQEGKDKCASENVSDQSYNTVCKFHDIYLIFLKIVAGSGSMTATCFGCLLVEEIILIVRCSKVILSSGLAAERLSIADLLKVIETAGDSLVAVAVESVEIDAGSAVYA